MEAIVNPEVLELAGDFFTIMNITRGAVLGGGMSGEVVLATHRDYPAVKRAAKLFSLLTPDGGISNRKLFDTEVRAMQGLSHPHIVKLAVSVRCPDYLVICTDYCPNGTLTSKLENMTIELCSKYIFQLASAVSYLNNDQRIVHDIKPDNIFTDGKNDAVLGDFGLSFFIPPDTTVVSTAGMGGTVHYTALEKLCLPFVDPYKLDVYSLGVVLMSMLCKESQTTDSMFERLTDMALMSTVPDHLRLCRVAMLQLVPDTRLTMADLLSVLHSFGFNTSASSHTNLSDVYFTRLGRFLSRTGGKRSNPAITGNWNLGHRKATLLHTDL